EPASLCQPTKCKVQSAKCRSAEVPDHFALCTLHFALLKGQPESHLHRPRLRRDVLQILRGGAFLCADAVVRPVEEVEDVDEAVGGQSPFTTQIRRDREWHWRQAAEWL